MPPPFSRLLAALTFVCFVAGCAVNPHPHGDLFSDPPLGTEYVVDGDRVWTRTGIDLAEGEVVEITAAGKIRVARWSYFGRDGDLDVGPEGTYDYPREDTYRKYPLAAAGAGPSPAFGLIGKFGDDGEPFPIGRHAFVRADRAGALVLGVNDFDHGDNRGAWHVGVRPLDNVEVRSVPGRIDDRLVLTATSDPRPVEDARVLVFFVDGLRYDFLREMAYAGYLPNFRELFFDGGIDVGPTFTVSPSNTLVATTASLTASWPDRTGLFTQLVFDRDTGQINYLATPEGPSKAAQHIKAQWWEAPFRDPERPPLFKKRVEDAGERFASTVLPVMPDYPPDRYFQRVVNSMPLFGAHLLKDYYFDKAETSYALDDVVDADNRVMMVYFAGVDSAMHRSPRGMWGESRRHLVRIDRHIGEIRRELAREDLADKTYIVLYADHGSTGGDTLIPQSYDLANDFFYRSLVDANGDGRADDGSGLGMNVLFQIDDVAIKRLHTDVPAEDFGACVSQAYDIAWVALPKGAIDSRDWKQTNDYAELTGYRVHPDFEPVDIPRRLLAATSERGNLYPRQVGERPVALVLMQAAPDAVLVFGQDDATALIERRPAPRGDERRFEYRYRVVHGLQQEGDRVAAGDAGTAAHDPLGYTDQGSVSRAWLGAWHDDREWLEATAATSYPDAVVSFAHMLLNDPDKPRIEPRARYDLFVVAARGWNFAAGNYLAAPDHGGPDPDEKRIPFLISGPGLAAGARVERPARIIDVIPTALEMAGIDYDPASVDGRPVREIWSPIESAKRGEPRPVPFRFDRGLAVPLPDDEVVHGPLGHDPKKWYDLHNLSANLASITSQEVVRLADRAADVVIPGNEVEPVGSGIAAFAHAYGRLPESKLKQRPAELLDALRLHTITIGELSSPTQSLQNIDRIALTLDWLRNVLNDPWGKSWPEAITPVTPIDLGLRGVVSGLLTTRRTLLDWMTRAGNWAITGIEGGVRASAEAASGAEWQTPQVVRVDPAASP